MISRTLPVYCALGAAALLAATWAAPSAGSYGVGGDPCGLISKAQVKAAVGLPKIAEIDSIGPRYPQETDGRVRSECKIFIWGGAGNPKLAKQKVANGTGAELFLQTWVTDDAGPDTHIWETIGYPEMLEDFVGGLKAVVELPGPFSQHLFQPPHLGAEGDTGVEGVIGPARIVGAEWFTGATHSITTVVLGEAKGKAVRKQLEKIAKVAVPASGL